MSGTLYTSVIKFYISNNNLKLFQQWNLPKIIGNEHVFKF